MKRHTGYNDLFAWPINVSSHALGRLPVLRLYATLRPSKAMLRAIFDPIVERVDNDFGPGTLLDVRIQ